MEHVSREDQSAPIAAQNTAPIAPTHPAYAPTHTAPFIFVVDDERFFCRLISVTLSSAGYRVITLQKSLDAPALIAQEQPNLLLLDVMMPGMSGLELGQYVRDQQRTHTLPLVIMTALDDTQDSSLWHQLEALSAHHLFKPFSRKQLLDVVQDALGA